MGGDEEAIRDLVALWHRATASSDVDTVLSLMSEDVVFLVAGKPPMRGRAAFEQGLRQLLTTHRIESNGDIQEIVVSGALAYSWTNLRIQITPLTGGVGVTREGSALSILRKRDDGAWVVVRDANLLPGTEVLAKPTPKGMN
jgi:uncharacterized protein (TIGR02246 family)